MGIEKLDTKEKLATVEKGNFIEERMRFYIEEIKELVRQTIEGIDIGSCKCSYYPIRSQVEMAMNGDIGPKFMGVKYGSEGAIEKLAMYFIINEI